MNRSPTSLPGPRRVGTVLLVALTACGGADVVEYGTVTDSSGVRIVQNHRPSWPEGAGIAVSPEPALVVGTLDGPADQQLDRVADATILPDGSLAILNAGPARVQLYGRGGSYRAALGRRGDGPGEFRSPRWLSVRSDTLMVFDPLQESGRLSLFSLEGTFIGSERVTVQGLSYPTPDLLLPDGSYLDQVSEGSIGWTEVGHVVYTRFLVRYPRDGSSVDTLFEAPGGEAYREEFADGISQSLVPFGREERTAVGRDRIYVGNGAEAAIEAHDLAGRHVLSIRIDANRREVTEQDRERWIAATLSASIYEARPDAAERARRRFDEAPLPDLMPVHGALATDAEGRLWVQRYTPPWEDGNEWWVFAHDGRWLGSVELPPGLEVFEIGEDYVLGLERDELDVESVVLLPMEGGG